MGPSTEPCGTPNSNGVRSDLIPSIITEKWRPVKYDENHFNTVPDNPNDNDRRCNIMWWSRVSNAADRSRRDRIDTIPSSAALSRSQVIRRRAVSVQWFYYTIELYYRYYRRHYNHKYIIVNIYFHFFVHKRCLDSPVSDGYFRAVLVGRSDLVHCRCEHVGSGLRFDHRYFLLCGQVENSSRRWYIKRYDDGWMKRYMCIHNYIYIYTYTYIIYSIYIHNL